MYYWIEFGLLIPPNLALSEEAFGGVGHVVWNEGYASKLQDLSNGDMIFSVNRKSNHRADKYSEKQLLHISVVVDKDQIIDATPENGISIRHIEELKTTHKIILVKRTCLIK